MVFELPTSLPICLVVKVGQPYSNSRTTYGQPIRFDLLLRDGHSVLRAKINGELASFSEITWGADAPILIRPSANTPQTKYEELSSSQPEFVNQLTRLWKLASRRKNGQADFQFELFVYVQRVGNGTGIRRATEARVAASAAAIHEHLAREEVAESYGPAAQRYWAISHARQPDGAPLVPPSSATFRQLQRVDEAQAEIAAAQDQLQSQQGGRDQRNFVRVTCRLNGGIVPLDLDVADLRRAMGLPSYDLFPPFRPTLDESSPAENIEDEDHVGV